MRSPVALLILLLALPGPAPPVRADGDPAADPKPRDVSALLNPPRVKFDIPGMAGALVEGERLVALGASGLRQRGKDAKVTVEDRWHLGSCTKAMTATLCAMLVEEGKIHWTTTVAQAFPDLAATMDPKWRGVTLSQLVTHRSGAPHDLDADGLWGRLWNHRGTPVEARRLLLEGVVTKPPLSEPGSTFLYSNAGFAIAGAMAETVTKKPWEELLRERLFDPLGMKSAGYGAPGTAEEIDQPRGHDHKGVPVPPGPGADNPAAIGPAGTVHASISDWAKFVGLHLTGDPADREATKRGPARLLKRETFSLLHAPAVEGKDGYAMGWGVAERPWGGGRVLSHSGSNTMWFCVTWVAPREDFAVLVCCNQGGDQAAKACDAAASALIEDHLAARKARGK